MVEHPPVPGGIVAPNFLGVMEALGDVTFPISKRDLLEQVGDGTAIMNGRNVSLHDLVKDLHDDFFESEEELRGLLENQHANASEDASEGEGVSVTADKDEDVEPVATAARRRGSFENTDVETGARARR